MTVSAPPPSIPEGPVSLDTVSPDTVSPDSIQAAGDGHARPTTSSFTPPGPSSPGHRAETSAATRAVRAGIESDRHHGAVVPPIHLSSNFAFAGFDQPRTYDYTRSGNPTRDLLARALAES